MDRRISFLAACLALAALLFAPLAISGHACPYMGDAAAMQAASPHGPSEAPPCERHCADSQASVDAVKPAAPAAQAILPVLRIAPPELPRPAVRRLERAAGFVARSSPPLTRFTVLRI